MTRRHVARGLAFMAAVSLLAACAGPTPSPKPACPTEPPTAATAAAIIGDTTALEVRTNKGNFTIELDSSSAPIAVANLVALAECGFYDGQSFPPRDSRASWRRSATRRPRPTTATSRGWVQAVLATSSRSSSRRKAPLHQYQVAWRTVCSTTPDRRDQRARPTQRQPVLRDARRCRPRLWPYYSLLGEVVSGTEVVDAIGQVPTSGDPLRHPAGPGDHRSRSCCSGAPEPS